MNKLVEKAISGWSYGGAVRDVEGGEILRHILRFYTPSLRRIPRMVVGIMSYR